MTEEERLTATDPDLMLKFVRSSNKASERKFRLFGCACCHRIWHLLINPWSQKAVCAAEQLAEGDECEEGVFSKAYYVSREPWPSWRIDAAAMAAVCSMNGFSALDPPRHLYQDRVLFTAEMTSRYSASALARPEVHDPNHDEVKFKTERAMQASIFRDVVGNPFRPVPIADAWQTSTIENLAETIYREKAFEGLPILGAALEESGCTAQDLLAHCRQPGEHVRGCWAIDLLLQKE